uniref:Uncharacterized protein n=1 Tax=Oryza rufipogon TaxID=4529 RepID=A0A0E0QH76_ORYRU
MMDPSSSSAAVPAAAPAVGDGGGGGGGGPAVAVSSAVAMASRRFQHLLDRSTPHVGRRWLAFAGVAAAYALRVDPEVAEVLGEGGAALPTRASDEFRPFVRRLPEFKFWYSIVKAFCIAFVLTFFITMKRQILHMIKYRYVPFSFGKQRYNGKRVASADDLTLPKD